MSSPGREGTYSAAGWATVGNSPWAPSAHTLVSVDAQGPRSQPCGCSIDKAQAISVVLND